MKISTLFLTLFLSFLSIFAMGQITVDWGYSFGDPNHCTNGDSEFWRTVTDSANNVYVTGILSGYMDLDPSPTDTTIIGCGSYIPVFFLAKYHADGSFAWARQFYQTVGLSYGNDLKLDSHGDVIAVGTFYDNAIVNIRKPDTTWINCSGTSSCNPFIVKYTKDGNFEWIHTLDCGHGGSAEGLQIDPLDNLYISGSSDGGIDLDPYSGNFYISSPNNIGNTFLAKYSPDCHFIWGKNWAGGSNYSTSLCMNSKYQLGLVGAFATEVYFPLNNTTTHYYANNPREMIMVQYDSTGTLLWSKHFDSLGYQSQVQPLRMVNDHNDSYILVGGYTGTIDLDPSPNLQFLTMTASSGEGFFAKYDSLGNYLYAHSLHGDFASYTESVAVNEDNEIYIYGTFSGHVDMDPGATTATLNANGYYDYFGKYSPTGTLLWYTSIGSNGCDIESHNLYYANSKIYISGEFSKNVDFDPTSLTYILNAPPMSNTQTGNGYLVRYTELPVGIPENNTAATFTIIPNPATDRLSLTFPGTMPLGRYEVLDILGHIVLSGNIQDILENGINIADLRAGSYFIRIEDSRSANAAKFIKI